MQSQEIMGPRLQFVGKFTLYVLPNGKLIATMGNQRVTVTPDQAAKLLEFMLLFAEQFRVGSIGGQRSICRRKFSMNMQRAANVVVIERQQFMLGFKDGYSGWIARII